ncbi:MAG: 23S rRNA (pseudouridine(1915)-N(3))-methyltransferase RlmH [Clostridiaceae bacterium]|nr:23S rRNA (pseudouridine(1915)-N(3))-methyltransferase RlmH [Clostridiaceae bacterium]
MLAVKIIAVGKLKEKFYIDACGEYLKRLKTMANVEIIELPEETSRADGLERESVRIFESIPKQSLVCAMCIEGKLMDSEAFAGYISDAQTRGFSQITFIIGSSNGLHQSVKERAELRLSISPMTFPHHLARVLVLEQVYRALSINGGSKYHK